MSQSTRATPSFAGRRATDIVVTVPHGCTGVDVGVEWPEAKGDTRDAPLAVQQRVVVEKPIQDYRVETGGAWLAYGKVEKPVDDDDDDDDDEEEEEEGAGGEDADDKEDPDRVVVDRVDAVDIDAEGGAAKGTAGAFVRADVSADEDDVGVGSSSTDDAPRCILDVLRRGRGVAVVQRRVRGRVRRGVASRGHDGRQAHRAGLQRRG